MFSAAGKKALAITTAILIAVGLLIPFFITSSYQLHLIIMLFINVVLAMSFSMLISTGLITIGAASFWAIGAYTSAILVLNYDLSFWIALPLATLVTGLVALALGAVIVRTPGVAFVVQTMVVNMIVVQALGQIEYLGGWGGILGIPTPDPIGTLRFSSKVNSYYLALFLLLIIVLAFAALYSSRIGRAWSAIRLNPRLAQSLGINLFRYRLIAFVISAMASGVVGSFYAHYFGTIEPGTFSVFKSIYVQIYGILGGLNFFIMGPIVGAFIMTLLPEFLRISKEIEPILTGAILVLLVIFLPGGILSFPEKLSSLRQPSRKIWQDKVITKKDGS
jgi:branched-chain amino acid transport system permease protein